MEDLGELDGVLGAVDVEVAADEAEDAVVDGGLGVEALDDVLDVAEGAELVEDVGDALELLALEAEHGVLGVELLEVGAVGVEHTVVVLHELLADSHEVHKLKIILIR